MQLIKFISKGNVQGVFYRKYVSKAMNKEGISGYIKNLPDGSVESVVKIDEKADINKILNILYQGSPKSDVKSVEMFPINENINLSNMFEVRY